jgi:hypothetical protein
MCFANTATRNANPPSQWEYIVVPHQTGAGPIDCRPVWYITRNRPPQTKTIPSAPTRQRHILGWRLTEFE